MQGHRSRLMLRLGTAFALIAPLVVIGAEAASAGDPPALELRLISQPAISIGSVAGRSPRSPFLAQHGYLTPDIPAYEAAKASADRWADERWASSPFRPELERVTSTLTAEPATGSGSTGALIAPASQAASRPADVGDRSTICNRFKTILGTRSFCLRFPKERPNLFYNVVEGGLANNQTLTPPDPTGAVGTTRFVQMVNEAMAIFDRSGNPLDLFSMTDLTGDPFLSDPQVMWDPTTNRFYYAMTDIDVALNGSTDGIDFVFGFSTSDSPSSVADWCSYFGSFGYDDPGFNRRLLDQPHLGDTRDFLLMGANVFDFASSQAPFVSTDVLSISKPPAGTSCPSGSTFSAGVGRGLTFPDGFPAFSAVPAVQTDPDTTGWIVSARFPEGGTANQIGVFRVTESGGGVTIGPASAIAVASYAIPANAPQAGSSFRLDTSDVRFTQAVSGFDPASGKLGIWTQHTVLGGAGAEVRWYEIDPFAPAILRAGRVSHPILSVFNAAVTNDRAFAAGVGRFGDMMMIGFNSSSRVTDSTVWTISQAPGQAISPWVMLAQSPGPNEDFSCDPSTPCRWGDYMGASPDPVVDPGAIHGSAWFSGMFNLDSVNNQDLDWVTVIARAVVDPTSTSLCTFSSSVLNAHLIGQPGDDSLCAGLGNSVLEGLGGSDFLLGGPLPGFQGPGNDLLIGGDGNDAFLPGGGNDVIDGGTGHNFLVYVGVPGPMKINLATQIATGAGKDLFSGITRLIGSDGNDSIFGSGRSEALFGADGNDTIRGGLGFDFLAGNEGNDFLDGGFGQDALRGDQGTDTCVRDPNVTPESQDLFSSCNRFVSP